MYKPNIKDAQILSAWKIADIFAKLAKNVIATQNAIRHTTRVFEQMPGFCHCSTRLLMRNGCQCNGI